MIKTWKVTAELNMDASKKKSVIVKANTERKARKFAEEKFKAEGAFFVWQLRVEEINDTGDVKT